jgi:hypothetical protein
MERKQGFGKGAVVAEAACCPLVIYTFTQNINLLSLDILEPLNFYFIDRVVEKFNFSVLSGQAKKSICWFT